MVLMRVPLGLSHERPVGGATRRSILRLREFVKHFFAFSLKNIFSTPDLVICCYRLKISYTQNRAQASFTFLPVKAHEILSAEFIWGANSRAASGAFSERSRAATVGGAAAVRLANHGRTA